MPLFVSKAKLPAAPRLTGASALPATEPPVPPPTGTRCPCKAVAFGTRLSVLPPPHPAAKALSTAAASNGRTLEYLFNIFISISIRLHLQGVSQTLAGANSVVLLRR